jgi:hypothetical protein
LLTPDGGRMCDRYHSPGYYRSVTVPNRTFTIHPESYRTHVRRPLRPVKSSENPTIGAFPFGW